MLVLALGLLMSAVVMVVSAQTVPTSPVTTAPFVGDARMCGSLPTGYAQTAAIYKSGSPTTLLLYEVNDRGVGTFQDFIERAAVIAATEEAEESDESVVLFSAPTYDLLVLPNGICQIQSTQIPTAEGKPFVCNFVCN